MIFATDALGNTTYVSDDWTGLTGRSTDQALRLEWLDQTHPADREMIRSTFMSAIRQHAPFSVTYRLKDADEGYVWVLAGAVPSFSAADQTFIGFMGSVTEIASHDHEELQGFGVIGSFVGTPPSTDTQAHTVLELVADHLMISHSLVSSDGSKELLPSIELALYQVAKKLASENDPSRQVCLH